MAAQISTGYQPEFGLGAVYSGINAANQEQDAQLELIKQALANMRAQQMLPIDVAQAQQTLESGAYKTSPEYQEGMRNTIFGQGKSNLAAGQTAELLRPIKEKAERARLGAETGEANQLQKLQELDAYLSGFDLEGQPVQMDQATRASLQKVRDDFATRLSQTPKFFGRKQEQEAEQAFKLQLQELINSGALQRVTEKPQPPSKMSDFQKIIQLVEQAHPDWPPQKILDEAVKQAAIKGLGANPKAYQESIDKSGFGMALEPSPIQKAQGQQPQPSLPAGWTMK